MNWRLLATACLLLAAIASGWSVWRRLRNNLLALAAPIL